MASQSGDRRTNTGAEQGVEFSGLIQSMLNAIAQPVSVKPGGYPEDIFIDLTEEEREQFECSICFLITKEPKECPNHHLFCSSCILTWSMSFSSETRSKCPVCRTDGRYRPNHNKENELAKKHVKCPEKDCSWAGKLLDYKWHRRRHDSNETRTLPPMMRTESAHTMNPASMANNLDAFAERLQIRRRHIQQHYEAQENTRRESLEEVESLSRRLGTVAQDIVHLLDNMQHDSRRFQQYLNETQEILPTITATPRLSPRGHTPRTSPRSEARVERIMSDATQPSNPFVLPDNLPVLRPAPRTPLIPLESRYTPRAADDRVRQLLAEPTPTANPFTLPDDLPILRPPPRTRSGLLSERQATQDSSAFTGNESALSSSREFRPPRAPRSGLRRSVLRRNAERLFDSSDPSCENTRTPRS